MPSKIFRKNPGSLAAISLTLCFALIPCKLRLGAAEAEQVKIDASKVVVERDVSLIGANLEDLNYQIYGGLYSQLLQGECFEEHVDPCSLLGLTGRDRLAVWVIMDEQNRPVLTYNSGRMISALYRPDGLSPGRQTNTPKTGAEPDFEKIKNASRPIKLGPLSFIGGLVLPEELPEDLRTRLTALATGEMQASRHWCPVRDGSVSGSLQLVRQGVFTGNQAQQIRFVSGVGEFGIDNGGLFQTGINLVAGKPYEGVLQIKSDAAQQVFVSLRSEAGKVLAEQALKVSARPGEYQRLTFGLTPSGSDPRGRFALTLRQPGQITVDYAFLQAGEWGRFKGLPVRKEMAEAIINGGVKTIRYNGSMNNRCPDLYRWKDMIGLRDQRRPYQGFFNPYASHGFTVFDMMDFGEAAGIFTMVGLNADETEQDMADFIDYCQGGPETEWGKRRVADGHPKPYLLQAIEIGNEQGAPEYYARFKALAGVIWKKNRDLDVVVSNNLQNGNLKKSPLMDLARWCREIGQEKRLVLDSHYYGLPLEHADVDLDGRSGMDAHRQVAEVLPGFNLRLWPMEENGNTHDWERGLGHAHNLNEMNRMPAALERAGTANTFQAWELYRVWAQGRIHFTPSQIIFQPPYYIDRMFADEWLPLVVQAESPSKTLDLLAKKSRDGSTLTLYIANISNAPTVATFSIAGFAPRNSKVTRMEGAPKSINTPENPTKVAPQSVQWKWDAQQPQMELPGLSFTTIRFSR